jgi:23S rRNA pseudouridine955/2504/2580 synthase
LKRIAVLFEDDDCLILNKPAGLAVQGGEGVGASLDAILAEEWEGRPLLVHRLDKDTSGVILAAKNRDAAARFAARFSRRGGGVRKIYLAVCSGRPEPAAGIIRTSLDIRGESKPAETRYSLVSTLTVGDRECSLLELELGTGRMHQIRRHLAQIGHPILGDDKYGDFALNRELRKKMGLKRLLLHASRLVVGGAAPAGGGIDVSAPLPEYFAGFVGA